MELPFSTRRRVVDHCYSDDGGDVLMKQVRKDEEPECGFTQEKLILELKDSKADSFIFNSWTLNSLHSFSGMNCV